MLGLPRPSDHEQMCGVHSNSSAHGHYRMGDVPNTNKFHMFKYYVFFTPTVTHFQKNSKFSSFNKNISAFNNTGPLMVSRVQILPVAHRVAV